MQVKYKPGARRTVIGYILVKNENIRNVKIIRGEEVMMQHRQLFVGVLLQKTCYEQNVKENRIKA